MGKWVHRLSGLNEETRTANCAECGPVWVKNKQGTWRCGRAANAWNKPTRRPRNWQYRKHVKDSCERCGFTPEHISQLNVHHVNGRAAGHDPPNLQTLCANCHRYITHAL